MKFLVILLAFSVIAGPCYAVRQLPPSRSVAQFAKEARGRVMLRGLKSLSRWMGEWPIDLRAIKINVNILADHVKRIEKPLALREKVNMLSQIWEIRQSLNFAALLEPEQLQYVTGMDPKQYRALVDQFKFASTMLKRKLLDAGTIQSSKLNART